MHSTYDVKMCILGQMAVGKTSLANAFANQAPVATVSTINAQQYRVKVTDKNQDTCYVQLWDTAGQERLQGMTSSYVRGAHGIVLLYDVTDPDSLLALKTVWVPFAFEQSAILKKETLVIVGNKCDLVKENSAVVRDAEAYCALHGYAHVLSSALDAKSAAAAFELCVNRIVDAKLAVSKPDPDIIRLGGTPPAAAAAATASNTCC